MKRILLVLAFFAFGSVAEAQAPTKLDNVFPTLATCEAALKSRDFRPYEPKYFGLKKRNPVNGVDRIVVPLEYDMCLDSEVVGGWKYVVHQEGTKFRALKLADGSLALYARDDCGNGVRGVVLPAPPPPVPEVVRPTVPLVMQPLPTVTTERELDDRKTLFVSEKKGGFCKSKKCRWTLAMLGTAAAGGAAWYYWPCPPGTVRK